MSTLATVRGANPHSWIVALFLLESTRRPLVITTHRATTKAYWESKKWHQQKPLFPPPKKLTREEEIQLREAYEAKQAERLRIASRISKVDHEQVLDSSARQIVASPQS